MNLDGWRLALHFAAGLAAMLGVVGLALVRRTERKTGFSLTAAASSADVVGSDTGAASGSLGAVLGLRGRPDYVLKVLVYESDELQVGAYLITLRATAGARAGSTGYVRYAAGTFRIDLSPDLERRVRDTVALIRQGRRAAVVQESHAIRARCAGCPVPITAMSASHWRVKYQAMAAASPERDPEHDPASHAMKRRQPR